MDGYLPVQGRNEGEQHGSGNRLPGDFNSVDRDLGPIFEECLHGQERSLITHRVALTNKYINKDYKD